jgi:LPS export ABC transporter protein LptC
MISFIRKHLKVVIAIAIPLVIAACFLYSQRMANQEIDALRREYKRRPSSQHIVINNYTMYEMDDKNPKHWSLVATKGEMISNDRVQLTGVKMEYYDQNTVKMRITAPAGDANADTKYVVLNGNSSSRVEAMGAGGKANLSAERIELMKKNQFIATGGVSIVWPGAATVSGDMATGLIDLSDFKDFKIMGNTHAQIMVN